MTTLALEDSIYIYLRGERGVSVVMMHHPGGWHGHIGDGHNHVSHTLVSWASAVGHLGHMSVLHHVFVSQSSRCLSTVQLCSWQSARADMDTSHSLRDKQSLRNWCLGAPTSHLSTSHLYVFSFIKNKIKVEPQDLHSTGTSPGNWLMYFRLLLLTWDTFLTLFQLLSESFTCTPTQIL